MSDSVVLDTIQLELENEASTEALGAQLLSCVGSALTLQKNVLTIFLNGNLGMGKTTITRGLMRALGHQGAVKSPTYTLVENYEFDSSTLPIDAVQQSDKQTLRVHHFDLYRLGDPEELEYLGIRDFFDPAPSEFSLLLVEWSERGEGILPNPDIAVELEVWGEGRRANLMSDKELLMPFKIEGRTTGGGVC